MNAAAGLGEEELERARNRLAVGRIIATETHPYLSKALFAMIPVAREGLGTFAVDKRWRLYYDPKLCLEWTTKEIAAVWLHEAGHLVREHARRFEQMSEPEYHTQWNHAADAAINSDLREDGAVLPDPDNRFYAEPNALYREWHRGMTAEEMYKIARGSADSPNNNGSSANDETADSGESDDSKEENAPSPSDSSAPSSQEESAESNQEDGGAEENDEEGSSVGSQDDAEAQSGASIEGEPGESGSSNADESAGSQGDATPEPHDCGSGASGGPLRDYEEPANTDDGSLDPDEADLVRQEVAKDILEANQRGNVPGGWVREANDILDPQVDWHTELMAVVRRVCGTVQGLRDYTYARPSRRSAMSQFYLPSMRSPRPPEIVVVLDTSGSMTSQDLAIALSEIQGIVERSSGRTRSALKVLSCDASASDLATVHSVEDIEILGGGGTDMRVGIAKASERTPRPDAVITITDGGTPWPTEPDDPRIAYINVIVSPDADQQRKRAQMGWFAIPEWMHTIYVDRRPSQLSL